MLSSTASVSAQSVVVAGALQVSQGAALTMSGPLTVLPGATLTPVVTINPGAGTFVVVDGSGATDSHWPASNVTVPVASFSSMTGSFVLTSAQAAFAGSECVVLGSPAATTTATTLSATMTVTPQPCSSGLSPGQLAGIVVGSVAGAVLVGLGIVAFAMWTRRQRTERLRAFAAARILDEK